MTYLLESLISKRRHRALEIIEHEDPTWASLLKNKILTIERILNFPEESLIDIASKFPVEFFSVLYHGLAVELFELLTRDLPKVKVKTIMDLAETLQPSEKDIEAMFLTVVGRVRSLERQGVINIAQIEPSLELLDPPKSKPKRNKNLDVNSPRKDLRQEEKWILIIDDEEEIRHLCGQAISKVTSFNSTIVEAIDGIDAEIKLEEKRYDCIITDLHMPRMMGEEFIKKCQENASNANTPLIIYTGYPDQSLERKFAHVRIFEKPMDLKKLAGHVENELRVGRTDKRIPAFLMNPFIEGTIKYLEQQLGIDKPMREKPLIKKIGEKLTSNVLATLHIQAGSVLNYIAFGFSNDLIGFFAEITDFSKNPIEQQGENIAGTISNGIFNEAKKIFDKQFIHPLNLISLSVSTNGDDEYKQAIGGGGIVIPISFLEKQILIKAISRPAA